MIELKKEFIVERTTKEFCEKTETIIEVKDNLIINTFAGLLNYIVRNNEDYREKISNRDLFKSLHNYINRYFLDILNIEISDVLIEENNDYYNTIIELIEDF